MGGTDHRPKPRQRKWALCIDAGDSFWDQNANWSLFYGHAFPLLIRFSDCIQWQQFRCKQHKIKQERLNNPSWFNWQSIVIL